MPKTKHVLISLAWLLCLPLISNVTDVSTATNVALATPNDQEKINASKDGEDKVAVDNSLAEPVIPEVENPLPTTPASDPPPQPEGAIRATIRCHAKDDAIFFDFKQQTIHIGGTSLVEYDTTTLAAEDIVLDWTQKTITASSKKNEKGEVEKKAVLTQDEVEYIAIAIRYHLDSQRAVATGLFTKQNDGLIRTDKLKKDRENTFYCSKCTYTTCNLTKPCFHVAADQVKLTQDRQVVSGPFRLYFDGVPTPLGFPFGIFYFPKKSGIIFPTYAGESDKGFGLTEGGYYFHFNDYADLILQGDIYSKLTTSFQAKFRYKKRYQYNGELIYESNRYRHRHPQETSQRLRYKHNTENNKTSSLAIDVDLQSDSFKDHQAKRNNKKTQHTNSSIRYTNRLVGLPWSLTAQVRYDKRISYDKTKTETATLPVISLSTRNIYPFQKKGSTVNKWYSNIYFQHIFEAKNELSNQVKDKQLTFSSLKDWPVLFENSRIGARHRVPLKTNINLWNYFTLTPNIEYQERWYRERLDYPPEATDEESGTPIPGFYRVQDYSFGGTLTTALYGTYAFKEDAPIQAIRHEIQPDLMLTYTPDFSDPKYEYFQEGRQGHKLNRFKQGIYGSPEADEKAVIQAKVSNRVEMKVKNNVDEKVNTKRVPLLKNFDWSTGYDFLAKEFALEDVKLDARTDLLDGLLTVQFNSAFDPYFHQEDGARVDEFSWKHGQGLGHMKNASLNIDLRLGPRRKSSFLDLYKDSENKEENSELKKTAQHIKEHAEQYVDFTIPWGLRLGYRWSYDAWDEYKKALKEPQKTNRLTFDGEVSLTENWKVTLRSAYDITKNELVDNVTDIGIYRDLHCWEMEFKWRRPFGEEQGYEFSIGVKSPLLQALRYSRKRGYTGF